jgi:hypothetical protein
VERLITDFTQLFLHRGKIDIREVASLSLLQMGLCWTIVVADVLSSDLKRLNPSLLVIEYIVALCDEGYMG